MPLRFYNKFRQLYSLPLKLVRFIRELYIENDQISSKDNLVKLANVRIKREIIFLEFQIKYSRATVYYKIDDIVNDLEFITVCHPSDLIQIGHLSKALEIIKLSNFINGKKRKPLFNRVKSIFFNKKRGINMNLASKREFPLSFSDVFYQNKILYIQFKISESNTMFNVPFDDFTCDKDLLFFTNPYDLIKIGYKTAELRNEFNLNSITQEIA